MSQMTLTCHQCEYEYGRWRPQCPACGTPCELSRNERLGIAPERVKQERTKRFKRLVADACAFCRCGHATLTCPHCHEQVHRECLELHRSPCLAFQLGVEQETRKLEGRLT